MKLRHKKYRTAIAVACAAAMAVTATGCSRGGSTSSSDGESLEFFLNMGADSAQYQALSKIIDAYEGESGVSITATTGGDTYEDQMKVRLASGDIPDLFSTHGWSLLRYSEFLKPLTDETWAADVNPALDSAMRDADGNIFAFPGETDVAGILYNKDVLDQIGVDPASITSWEAFDSAAESLAAQGTVPIYISGKDQGSAGILADFLAADTFTEAEQTQMQEGTFVDSAYALMLDKVHGWQQNGWFNPDYSSASRDDMARALADGTTGFEIAQNAILSNAFTYNPDANLGFIPLPPTLSDEPYLVGGEGVDSFGVSKTSQNKEAALKFLDYLAQPENAAALAESTASAPGLLGIDVDYGNLTDSFTAYVVDGNVPVKPYFDRVFLPNGMWNTMVVTTDSVITGQATVDQAVDQVRTQFETLFGA